MHNPKTNPKKYKLIPSLIAFGVITFYSMPASSFSMSASSDDQLKGLTINPLEGVLIDSNANDSSPMTSKDSTSSSPSNEGNPSPSNSNNNNNNNGGGGGSFSPFVTNPSDDSSDSADNNNGGVLDDETSLLLAQFANDNQADSPEGPQNQASGRFSDTPGPNSGGNVQPANDGGDTPGIGDNIDPGDGDSDGDGPDLVATAASATSIPEPTSVTALAIIGLVGILAKRNRRNSL